MIGTTGKYQLIRKLATGGMAEVFLARAAGPMGFEKTVVVKRILPHLADQDNFISMFLSEARLAAQLNHPNVVQVFDFGEADGVFFLVMELIDGVNLRVLFRRANELQAPIALPLVARIISLACEGLSYAHQFTDPATGEPMGLVHRDISADNILLARNGSVKVVDFGIAKAANQTALTKTGTVKGKFSYMSPEQLTGQPLDQRADVFSLGLVLFELIAGRKPFETANEGAIVQAIMYEPMAPAARFRPDVPDALQRILNKALAKSRDDRYPDCRAMQTDLERFIHDAANPVAHNDLAQLVQTLAPTNGASVATPMPSAPPIQPRASPPTAVLVAPPPPPQTTGTIPHFVVPPPALVPPALAPPAPQGPAVDRVLELGSISLREESDQRDQEIVPRRPRALTLPFALLAVSALLGSGLSWLFLQSRNGTETVAPTPEPVVAQPPPPEPVVTQPPAPEPVVTQPPAPEPVVAQPPAPEPVVAKPATPQPTKPLAPVKKPVVRGPAVEAVTAPTQAAKGEVEFRVRPFGAVWVDGQYLGETPFSPAAIAVGAHSVRVVNRDLGQEVTRQFEVKEGSNVFRHSFAD